MLLLLPAGGQHARQRFAGGRATDADGWWVETGLCGKSKLARVGDRMQPHAARMCPRKCPNFRARGLALGPVCRRSPKMQALAGRLAASAATVFRGQAPRCSCIHAHWGIMN